MIVENKNIRYMKLKELRTNLTTQKYPKMTVEKEMSRKKKLSQFPRHDLEVKN